MKRREGDTRPLRNTAGRLENAAHGPVRWLPRHGDPYCPLEWLSQALIRLISHLPVYTAVIVTLTLIVVWVTR